MNQSALASVRDRQESVKLEIRGDSDEKKVIFFIFFCNILPQSLRVLKTNLNFQGRNVFVIATFLSILDVRVPP